MKIVIDGEPVAQIRMKFSGRNGIGRMYDPRAREKDKIKDIISRNFVNFDRIPHPRVSFIFHMSIPKSIPKRRRAIYESGLLKHEKKPDTDNFIKLYLDCMDGICFDGDQKVMLGPSIKLYHPHPKTIIIINSTEELLSPLEVDSLTWNLLFGSESGKCSSSEMDALPDFYSPDRLESSQCSDKTYPQQTIPSSLLIPSIPQILERVCHA